MNTICPICATRRVSLVCDHQNFPGAGIYLCGDCQHWFAYPEPDYAWLDDYYTRVYSPQRRKYFGNEYDAIMQRRAEAQVRFVKRMLRVDSGASNDFNGWKILDPGCGIGALVAAFEKEGARAAGYDSDPIAIERGRGLWGCHTYVTAKEAVDYCGGPVDLICTSHILEHVPDITTFLLNTSSMLRRKGYLFVEVPNCFPEMFEAGIDHESHLQFFTAESLVRLFSSLQARVVGCQTCGPPKHSAYGPVAPQRSISMYDRLVRLLTHFSGVRNRLIETVGGGSRVSTQYDGYYERYYEPHDTNGIWLRCLVQMGEYATTGETE